MAVPFNVLLLLSGALAGPPAAQVAGTWRLASQPDLPALIDQATASLPPDLRPKVRSRLQRINQAHGSIAITQAAGQITITYDDWKPQRMPDSGLAVPLTREDGEHWLVSARTEGRNLVQTWLAGDGMLENRFHAENGKLTLRVRVKAFELPRPFTYTLTYRH